MSQDDQFKQAIRKVHAALENLVEVSQLGAEFPLYPLVDLSSTLSLRSRHASKTEVCVTVTVGALIKDIETLI